MAWKTVQEIRDALADINDPAVDRLDIEVRPDSTGEPAVFVTVVFRDADLREGGFEGTTFGPAFARVWSSSCLRSGPSCGSPRKR